MEYFDRESHDSQSEKPISSKKVSGLKTGKRSNMTGS